MLSFLLGIILTKLTVQGAVVDTIAIPATKMGLTYKAAIITPDSYKKETGRRYPVIYLLHGAWGHFNDWLLKTPDSNAVKRLANQYQLIIVNPEGEMFSFYLNSPINPKSQFESYFIDDIIPAVDRNYRTIAEKKGRAITGLSMGGHGSLYLAARHPNLFCGAGSMSGAVDIVNRNYQMSEDAKKQFRALWEPILGPEGQTPDPYIANSVMSHTQQLKDGKLAILFDCGTEDFLIEANRELHRRLVYMGVPHEYLEKPGGHTWPYWQDAIPYQVYFFSKVLAH